MVGDFRIWAAAQTARAARRLARFTSRPALSSGAWQKINMRGRKPKPTALKLVTGNPGKRPLNADEPRPPAGLPGCPPHLDQKGKTLWRELAGHLAELGAAQVDAKGLEQLCSVYATIRDCDRAIKAGGLTYESQTELGSIIRPRPEVAIRAAAWREFRALLVEFGLTPSSRSRLRAPARDSEDEALDNFIKAAR